MLQKRRQHYPFSFIGIFAPKRILPKRGFVRKNLLNNKQNPTIIKLVAIAIVSIIVGDSIPTFLTHAIESFIKK